MTRIIVNDIKNIGIPHILKIAYISIKQGCILSIYYHVLQKGY